MTPIDDWSDSPWMPPSPHREAVLERLAAGRAHIEEQGHGKPPLLVHEDGGVLELHKARVGSWDLYSEDTADAPAGSTKHVDVCGTIDEIEKWLQEESGGAAADPARLEALLTHALHMCGRMQRRWAAYREFGQRVGAVAERLAAITGPECAGLEASAEGVREAAGRSDYEHIVAHAEAIRDVANALEQMLRKYRDAATDLAALYEDVRGARDWSQDVEARVATLRTASGLESRPAGNAVHSGMAAPRPEQGRECPPYSQGRPGDVP